MGRPRTITDERILEEARACFIEQGPQVSTATIAARLGVSQSALFKRFGTKEDLMIAALLPDAPPWQEVLGSGPDSRPIPEQLRELGGHMLEFMARLMPCIMVLRASGMSHERIFARFEVPPPVRGHRALTDWFRSAQAQGRVGAGDPSTMATAFMGSVNSAVFLQHIGGQSTSIPQPAFVDELVSLFWRALDPA